MTLPSRFRDNGWKNWLKCSLAFNHCKENLHNFVNSEVNKFHAHIKRQITAIHRNYQVRSQCSFCTSWKIQHTGGQQGIWYIDCKNEICDKWLSQILLEHNKPHSDTINWQNANICKWPIDGYEVAKIYMPKGQDKIKNLPQDFDVSAVLSLFKYCKWFTRNMRDPRKLIRIASGLIDIRNEAFHSKDLRVTDSMKDTCIDNTVQLLTDLGINPNVVSELQKLKFEDVDINYRETEVKALSTMLSTILADHSQLSSDLSIAIITLNSEKGKISSIKGNTTETAGKVDTLETAVQGILTELKQRRETFQKIKSFIENNPDIDDKNITENIREIEKTATDLQSRLREVEKDIAVIKTAISEIPDIKTAISEIPDIKTAISSMKRKFAEGEEIIEKKQMRLQEEIEGLRDELLSRYKSLRTIPISPFNETEGCPFEDLYTDVIMQCKDEERNKRPLFKESQRIILTGLPGSGKSTFCRKTANRWYKLQEKKKMAANEDGAGPSTYDPSNVVEPLTDDSSRVAKSQTDDYSHVIKQLTNVSLDVATDSSYAIADEDLLKFDLLFYIDSRVISNETKLVELLCNQCIKRERERDKDEIQEKVAKLLSDQSEKILIIFDGLDELGHAPNFLVELFRRDLYPRVTVLMGMRPWQISRLGLKSRDHYDLYLDIQGFSKDNALLFVKKVIDLNRMHVQTKLADISGKDENILLSFKNVPLLLLFLAHILYSDQSLPDKRKNLYNRIIGCLITRCLTKMGNKYIESTFHEKYLDSACKAAHHFLLKREGGVSVAIPQKELIQELGDDADGDDGDMKLHALLDCGIMSIVDFFSPLEKNVSVTFLHMSVQEYLASIHLVKNEDDFRKFLLSLKTLNDVLRYENLFIFVCGLDASRGHEAFIRICQVCDVDPLVIELRHNFKELHGCHDIHRLNNMYKTCIDEMDKTKPLKIPDIVFDYGSDKDWYKLVASRQRSCYFESVRMSGRCIGHDVFKLSSLTCLTSITLMHHSLSKEKSLYLCSSISSLSCLQKLELEYITLTDGELDLSKLHDLTFLRLWRLNISEQCSETLFSSIRACTKLKKLDLRDTKLHDGVLALHIPTLLEYFSLNKITLNSTLHLTHLTILKLTGVTMSVKCIQSLVSSISACTKLKKLELCYITLHDGVLALHTLACLISIDLDRVVMSDECSRSLCSSISGCTCLETLLLANTSLNNDILVLNSLTNLKMLTLMSATMSVECIQSLVSSISACTNMESLYLRKISLHDSVFNLKTLTSLTYLFLNSLTMSLKCARSLVSSISDCTNIEILGLGNISLHDGVLDLKTLTSLTRLELDSLTMSVECARSLVSSISDCTNMETLDLIKISLHDGVLDLKTLTSLTRLKLDSLTMSMECARSLVSSIGACTNLKQLTLKRTSLHDGVLDLKKFRHSVLCISNVEMSDECRKILKESEKHCPYLRIE